MSTISRHVQKKRSYFKCAITCPCGELFFELKSRARKKYCSVRCSNNFCKRAVGHHYSKPLAPRQYFSCDNCGKVFGRTASYVRNAKKRFCSKDCNIYMRRGETNPRWLGKVYQKSNEIRRSPAYVHWAKDIYRRDEYQCQICGESKKAIRANHIKKFSDYPDLRFDLNNGIVICVECDYRFVLNREPDWESYFQFNLMARGLV